MNYNYHTHTYRCGHASGTDEEYVLRAIEAGITHLGFSDHVPLKFSDGSQSTYRCPMEQAQDYVESIRSLAEKYKDKIDIKVGFEAEYYPTLFDETLSFIKDLGADYLILGQHFLKPEDEIACRSGSAITDCEKNLSDYVDVVTSGMKTGKFTYVAHPDIINFVGDKELLKEALRKICVVSKEIDIPLEINLLGVRDNRHYPRAELFEVAGEIGNPITFGSDAHSPVNTYDTESVKKALNIVKQYGLNYIGKPNLKPL